MLFISGKQSQASGLFFGILVIFSNLWLFNWVGTSQKLFALKTPIIVLKYTIWAGLIYLVINKTSADKMMFVVGLSLLVVSLLIFAGLSYQRDYNKKEN